MSDSLFHRAKELPFCDEKPSVFQVQQAKLSFLNTLIHSLNEPACVVSAVYQELCNIETVNSAFKKALNCSAQEMSGTSFHTFFKSVQKTLEASDSQAFILDSREPYSLQITYPTTSHQALHIEAHFTPFFEPNASDGLWLVLFKGVGLVGSIGAAEQQATLIQVLHDLLTAHTFQEGSQGFVKYLVQSESCIYASLWWRSAYGERSDTLRQIASEGVSQALSFEAEEVLFHQLLLSASAEPGLALPCSEKESVYALPLYVENKVCGVLFLVSDSVFTQAHFSLYSRFLGQILGIKFERKRLAQALVEWFAKSSDPIMYSDHQGTVHKMNVALRELFAYTSEVMPVLWDWLHPQDLGRFKALYENLQPGGESVFEGRCIKGSGETLHVTWTLTFSPENDFIYHIIRDNSQKYSLGQRLEQAYALARMGTFELDIERNAVYWSQVTRDIYEIDDPDYKPILGSGINYFHPDDQPIIQAALDACIATGESWDLKLRIITAKGSTCWVRTVCESEFEHGKCQHVFGVFMDIHAQKLAEIAQEQQARMLALLNVLHQRFLSERWQAVLPHAFQGFTNVLGVDLMMYLHRSKMPSLSEGLFLPAHIQAPSLKVKEELLSRLDHLERGVFSAYQVADLPNSALSDYCKSLSLVSVWVLPFASGEAQGLLVMGSRNTACAAEKGHEDKLSFIETFAYSLSQAIVRQESLDELQSLNVKLAKHVNALAYSNQELEQFAYVASHDLQEPLRMVTSFLNQLERKYKDRLDEKAQRYIYFATDGAHRMRQLILDLLDYSRLGNTEQVVYESLIPEDLMQEVSVLLKQKIDDTQAQITWDLLPVLSAPRVPLRVILQNLVENALKYIRPEAPPRIHVTLRSVLETWQFSVQDNGLGIEPVYFDKIFVIFQRLHGKEMYGGTGVGLAVCKKIIEQCHGKIWVESALGEGSTFYFQIPKGEP